VTVAEVGELVGVLILLLASLLLGLAGRGEP
jgi:hypothetical protein